ncbi:Ig-like domain-containing protein, partial [Flavobacterium psychrophilum]
LPTITGTLNACVGTTTQLTGLGTANTTNPWVSDNIAIATVSNTGLVTGVTGGTAIITYTNSNGCATKATVTINN